MGFRFRKIIKLAPGIRLNLSKSGISASFGKQGASVNVGKQGTFANVGIPGSGISFDSFKAALEHVYNREKREPLCTVKMNLRS